MTTMTICKTDRMGARVGEHSIGELRGGYLFLGQPRGFTATRFKPEVEGYGSYSTSMDVKPFARLKGQRHYKAGQTNRIWVYVLGDDTAAVMTCLIGEGYGTPMILVDLATARQMWSNLK